MAARRGLPSDWLNSNATGFMPNGVGPREPDRPGLTVELASPQVLVAMKILAGRSRDFDDLVVLVRDLGLTDPHQVLDIVHEVYREGWGPRMPSDDELMPDARDAVAEVQTPRDR